MNTSYSGYGSNQDIVAKYLQSEESSKYVIQSSAESVLTENVIEQILAKMIELGKVPEANQSSYKTALESYAKEMNYLVPCVSSKEETGSKVITYYVTKSEYDSKFSSGGQMHGPTSLLCYEGKWYFVTGVNYNGSKPSAQYIPTNFSNCKDIQSKFDELVESGTLIRL